jgi:cell division septum initiation protein DivIVA
MPIRPEDLSVSGLPRTSLPGGLKTEAVDDLLRRAAWDYQEALAQLRQFAETVQEQARRIEELEARLASGGADAGARKDPDELGRTLLEAAQRAARERREEARREAELLLKKAARRAERIELDTRRRLENSLAEVEELEAFRAEISRGLRSTLETIVALGADGAGRVTDGSDRATGDAIPSAK